MKRGYKELVGLQVTFSKVIDQYSLTHYYRWYKEGVFSPILTMRGYDMDRAEPEADILEGLRKAYGPAILSIWHQDTEAFFSEYQQLQPLARPDELVLLGEWIHWAEW